MPKGVYAVASAMLQEQRSMDAVAENLANSQSPGFRKVSALRQQFADIMAMQEARRGNIKGDGGAGVAEAGTYRSFAAGELQLTGNPFDLALGGEGFFMVRDNQGRELLTRDGQFTLDENKGLVNQHGWPVLGQGGAITLPPDGVRIDIDSDGRIWSQSEDGESVFVEQLRIADVDKADRQQLKVVNGQYFDVNGVGLNDAAGYRLRQGAVENANVDPVQELVRMVAVQRRYDAAQRALTRQMGMQGMSDILRGVS